MGLLVVATPAEQAQVDLSKPYVSPGDKVAAQMAQQVGAQRFYPPKDEKVFGVIPKAEWDKFTTGPKPGTPWYADWRVYAVAAGIGAAVYFTMKKKKK